MATLYAIKLAFPLNLNVATSVAVEGFRVPVGKLWFIFAWASSTFVGSTRLWIGDEAAGNIFIDGAAVGAHQQLLSRPLSAPQNWRFGVMGSNNAGDAAIYIQLLIQEIDYNPPGNKQATVISPKVIWQPGQNTSPGNNPFGPLLL